MSTLGLCSPFGPSGTVQVKLTPNIGILKAVIRSFSEPADNSDSDRSFLRWICNISDLKSSSSRAGSG